MKQNSGLFETKRKINLIAVLNWKRVLDQKQHLSFVSNSSFSGENFFLIS